MNRTCPYCQSKIKNDAPVITCSECKIPHHKECYEFNGGCTTYGCKNNHHSEENVDIGSGDAEINSEDLRKQMLSDNITPYVSKNINPVPAIPESKLILCPNCKKDIEESSVFCKYCGFSIKHSYRHPLLPPPAGKPQINPVKKYSSGNKLPIILLVTGLLLLAALTYGGYFVYKNIDEHFRSVDYTVEKTIDEWISVWEKKDIVKYRTFLTSDYEYYDTDGKVVKLEDRMKRLEWTFQNYKNIKISISDLKIYKDSDTATDLKVIFKQKYDSDQYKAYGTKTLRLYRTSTEDTKWKIYREFFEE